MDKMAAGSSVGVSGAGTVGEVEDLLARAMRAVQSISQNPETTMMQNTQPATTNHPVDPTNMAASSRPTGTPGVNTELQRLFPHLYGTSRRPACTFDRASSARQCSRKRGSSALTKGKRTKFLTRKFFCLADKDQSELPTQQEKRQLFVRGLGERKLSLPYGGSAVDLQHCLMEEFTQLHSAGGFELMYVEPGKRDLIIIPPGPKGHAVEYVANFIGQGRAYIRPIQNSISLAPTNFEKTDGDKAETNVPEELCNNCLNLIPLSELRRHTMVSLQEFTSIIYWVWIIYESSFYLSYSHSF